MRALFQVLLDASSKPSDEIVEARERFWHAHVDEARRIVDRAIARSELAVGTDPAILDETLIGPALLRLLLMGRDLGAVDASVLVSHALASVQIGRSQGR